MNTIKNILRFTGLVVGTPTAIAHNLNINGVGIIPDVVTPEAGSFTVIADATNVTVTRNVGDADNVDVYAAYWHTENRAFGSAGTPFSQLTPAPFVMNPGGSGQAAPFLIDGSTVNIYVDSINSLNTNDGLTTTTAIQTFRELYTKFPIRALMRSQIIVHLAGVGGFGASATAIADYDVINLLVGGDGSPYGCTYVYRGPQMVAVVPTTGPATAALDVVPVVAVAGGSANAGGLLASRFDFTAAAPGWTVDDFNGKFLRITRAGTLVIYEAPIATNTADSITILKNGLAAAPDAILATDTVEIVEPGARFINTTLPALDFNQVRISGLGTSDFDIADSAPNPAANGLTFTRVQWQSSPLIQGAWNVEFDRCYMGDFSLDVRDSSIYMTSCSASEVALRNAKGCGWPAPPNPDSATSPIVANRLLYMDLQCTNITVGDPYGRGHWYTTHGLGFAGATLAVDLLFVGQQSWFQATEADGIVQGGGGPATLAGIRCVQGGYAQVHSNSTPGRTSVAGAGGDLKVGRVALAYIDYGTGVGDFEEIAGFNGNFQRIPSAPGDLGDTSMISTARQFS